MPAPTLVRFLPLLVWPILPEMVMLPLVTPMVVSLVKLTAPVQEAEALLELKRAPLVLMPLPSIVSASPAIAWPLRSIAAPEATTVPADVVPSAFALPRRKVPALTVVVPL